MFAGGKDQGSLQPGFFRGLYGGPRANVSQTHSETNANPPAYNFMKSERETEQVSETNPKSVEPLNADILEGCANLSDQTGKRVQVILRDGRIIIGEFSSVDHFSNIILMDAVERIVVGKQFGDIKRGIYIIRGDNIVLIGEVDGEKEGEMERVLQQVPTEEILIAEKYKQDEKHARQAKYSAALKQRGVSFPKQLEDDF